MANAKFKVDIRRERNGTKFPPRILTIKFNSFELYHHYYASIKFVERPINRPNQNRDIAN